MKNKKIDDYEVVKKLVEEKKDDKGHLKDRFEDHPVVVSKNGGKFYLYAWMILGAAMLVLILSIVFRVPRIW